MSRVFKPDAPATKRLTGWWAGLQDDRGTRAELRRCANPQQVLFTPAYQRLCAELTPHMEGQYGWEERLAGVIGLLAHVKASANKSLAEAMAGKPPVVSELRFRRLLQRDRNNLYGAMIRILRMLDGKANLPDLMASVFDWDDGVRKRWSFAYFPNTPAK